MSTLQLALAVVGGAFIFLLVLYTAYTSRRNTPRQADPTLDENGPAASPPQRLEPGLDGAFEGDTADGAPFDPADDPVLGALGASTHGDGALGRPMVEKKPGLDPLIDVIAPMALDHLVSGDAALAALPPTRRAGSKTFAVEGLNDRTLQWETPVAGQRYRGFQAGVQLANRTGALNEIEFSEYVVKAQAFADAINAAPDFPDMLQEVARARELDQFANDHDAQLTISVRALQAAWSPGYLHQNAMRLGFVATSLPGRMQLPAAAAHMPPIIGMAFDPQAAMSDDPTQSAIRELTLSLDASQVQREETPFARLRETAAALAVAMDGVVTDHNGQPLQAEALDTIAEELEMLYDTLEGRDFAAGSVLARRLFS